MEIESEITQKQKDRLLAIVNQMQLLFEQLKIGETLTYQELAATLETDVSTVMNAINILRMNGILIIENSTGLFLCKTKEQYDIWWRLYMQPAMQAMIAIQRGMSDKAKELPRILKYTEGGKRGKT